MTEPAKTPFKRACDEWFAKDEGMDCCDPSTIYLPTGQSKYLINRLWRAFRAGWDAHMRHVEEAKGKNKEATCD